jgi:SAM-dependent methyltransferase
LIDALTSPTLKHLREHWWDGDFTEFLAETLKPRPGNRILDVGCGEGLAEVSIGRLQISQVRLTGVDLVPSKVGAARQAIMARNQRATFAAGDACRLPFAAGVFDSIFCVAVLQHIGDADAAVGEIARVSRPRARVVAVEPDNSARYFFSSASSGRQAFLAAGRLFAALAESRNGVTDPAIGPTLPGLFETHRIEPLDVRLFPVSHAQLGAPPEEVWVDRRRVVDRGLQDAGDPRVRSLASAYADALRAYEAEARRADGAFVEIQHTMLFATVGQRLG